MGKLLRGGEFGREVGGGAVGRSAVVEAFVHAARADDWCAGVVGGLGCVFGRCWAGGGRGSMSVPAAAITLG